jgi:hypothetical protein
MNNEFQLSYLSDEDRLNAYQTIVNGCNHLYSKGKLQKEKLNDILSTFITLAEKDPIFLAHFTSYAITKSDNKDLHVITTFANSLSDADGTPFIIEKDAKGRPVYSDKFKKPNLRIVSQAAVQHLDPKLISRIIEIANIKQALGTRYKEGTHFSKSLKTAIKKWVKIRENNPKAMASLKKNAFSPIVQDIYRMMHMKPSKEAAELLNWKQGSKKKNNVEVMEKKNILSFKGLSDIEVAEKIRTEKISPLAALPALKDKLSPVIAVALLEQCSGNQAVIFRGMFDSQGLLKDKEVLKVFSEKIKTAKTALDRVEKINTEIDPEVGKMLKSARADKRKKDVGNVGKMFLHLDISGSMTNAIEFAKDRGAIIAECITNPEENFNWGAFNEKGYSLPRPSSFEKDGFMAALYGLRPGGGTNILACYPEARRLGCDIDVYVTDQDHQSAPIGGMITHFDGAGYARPKAVVIVDFSNGAFDHKFKKELESVGIPVSVIRPDALKESALVTEAIRTAMLGTMAIIDTIIQTEFLKLPDWWEAVS